MQPVGKSVAFSPVNGCVLVAINRLKRTLNWCCKCCSSLPFVSAWPCTISHELVNHPPRSFPIFFCSPPQATPPAFAPGLDSYSYKEPLGVCAGVCPFNFPAMIPLWMFPMAIACGNTYILKPSERDPGAAMMLARMAHEAG